MYIGRKNRDQIEIPDYQKYFLIDSGYFITYYRNVYDICTRNQYPG